MRMSNDNNSVEFTCRETAFTKRDGTPGKGFEATLNGFTGHAKDGRIVLSREVSVTECEAMLAAAKKAGHSSVRLQLWQTSGGLIARDAAPKAPATPVG